MSFATKVLNISEKDAAVKLRAYGCSVVQQDQNDKKLEKMLTYASSPAVLNANESADLFMQVSENYKKGFSFHAMLGKLMPTLHKHVFSGCINSNYFDPNNQAKRCRITPASWEQILLLPMFSNCMRTAGFCLLGGNVEQEPAVWYSVAESTGLCYHPKLLHSSVSEVIALQNPLAFLRLCSSWLYFKSSCPPFVLWSENTSDESWEQLKHKSVCLVGDSPTQLLSKALKINAKIKLVNLPNTINKHTIVNLHSAQLTVSGLLTKLTRKYDNATFSCFVDELKEVLGEDIHSLMTPEYCVFGNRVRADGLDLQVPKRVTVGAKTYRQLADCWVDSATNTTVSTATMSVDEICGYPDGTVAQFGTVSFMGNKVEFEYRGSAFKNHYADTAKKAIISNGVGIPVIKNAKVFKDIVEAISSPTHRRAHTDAGWDAATKIFATKNFIVGDACGVVIKPVRELAKLQHADLKPTFSVLDNRISELVSRQNANTFSLWLAFMHNIVAPIFGGAQVSFVCSKKYKRIFHKVASIVSAKEIEIFNNKLVTSSAWPTTFTPNKHSETLYINKIAQKQPVLMLLQSDKDLIREHLLPNKIYLRARSNQLAFSPLLLEGATQSLIEHCVDVAYMYDRFSMKVFREVVASWLSKHNASTKTLYYVFSNFKKSRKHRVTYGVAQAIKQVASVSGQLQRVPEEFFGDYKYWSDDSCVTMTMHTLQWILKYTSRCDSFNMSSIMQALMSTGAVVRLTSINTQVCVAFDKQWWLKTVQSHSLKIYNQKMSAS